MLSEIVVRELIFLIATDIERLNSACAIHVIACTCANINVNPASKKIIGI